MSTSVRAYVKFDECKFAIPLESRNDCYKRHCTLNGNITLNLHRVRVNTHRRSRGWRCPCTEPALSATLPLAPSWSCTGCTTTFAGGRCVDFRRRGMYATSRLSALSCGAGLNNLTKFRSMIISFFGGPHRNLLDNITKLLLRLTFP